MVRSFLLSWWAGVALLAVGCDASAPAPVTSNSNAAPAVPPPPPAPASAVPSPSEVPSASAARVANAADEVERMPSKSAGMTSSPKTVAFLEANRGVVQLQDGLRDTMLTVVDDETARHAAATLPAQIDAWETAQKAATAMFLTLSDSEKNAVMGLAADEMLAKGRPSGENMVQIMKRLASSPQRPILHDSLVKLRDVFLAQHSIYAPKLARERMAKELGAAGSPLPE